METEADWCVSSSPLQLCGAISILAVSSTVQFTSMNIGDVEKIWFVNLVGGNCLASKTNSWHKKGLILDKSSQRCFWLQLNRSALCAEQCGFSFSGIQWGYVNPFNLATQIRLAIPLQSQKPPSVLRLSLLRPPSLQGTKQASSNMNAMLMNRPSVLVEDLWCPAIFLHQSFY